MNYFRFYFYTQKTTQNYSFDARGRPITEAKATSAAMPFGPRAFFNIAGHPAQLKVNDIRISDAGMYQCRVDFRNSPTRNLKVNLTVIGKCFVLFFF